MDGSHLRASLSPAGARPGCGLMCSRAEHTTKQDLHYLAGAPPGAPPGALSGCWSMCSRAEHSPKLGTSADKAYQRSLSARALSTAQSLARQQSRLISDHCQQRSLSIALLKCCSLLSTKQVHAAVPLCFCASLPLCRINGI